MISHSNTSLSAAQKRIWFDCQNSDVLQNHVVLAYELEGEFSPSIMQQALSQLVVEHDIFRTTIFSSGKNLERFVHEHIKVELKCLSLDPYSDIYPTIQHLVKKPFNIATGPLFRFNLLQKSPENSILILVFHRLIINTCVLKKIVKEISTHYQDIYQHSSLIEPSHSYDELVAYEKKYREESHYRETIRHWSNRIKDKKFHLDLTKLPESEESHSQVRSKRITLDEKIHKRIINFCKTFSCTPENIFLTVLQTLLYRYTDTQDIVVNRPEEIIYKEEWKTVLGPTGNIIPWNVRLNANMNFLDLIAQNEQFDRYKEYYPHAHITDIVRTVRSRFNHHFDGFFSNVSFEQEYIPFHEFILPNVTVRALPQYIHRTRTEELQVFFDEYNNHFFLSFDYASKISSKAIQNFSKHYECLLQNLLEDPTKKLSVVNFLPSEAIKKILGSSTFSSPNYPDIITSFEKAAELYPNYTAVIDENESFTYQQLNQAANQLAHALKKHGTQSNHCIGLAMGRNVRMVIATLGILKSGAAYVPLDPAYPKERLTYMIQDATISLVITENAFESLIKSCHAVKTLLLNKSLKSLQAFSKENLPIKPQLEDLAYVIYTSGSTGKPKGVLVPHRGLPNLAAYQKTLFSLESKTRCLQAGSINFDITAFELFAPLIFGGSLYIANDEQRRSPLKLQEFIIHERIEVVITTPSVLSHFAWIAMPDVRVITVCGEACDQKLMDFWAHGRTFINGYGPTEITMGSHFKIYEPNTLFNNLGPVIPNVNAFILDSHKNLLPDGIPGELYVGGVGVAKGYLNLPEQTHEKFIASPLRGFPPLKKGDAGGIFQNILYRTNDIAYRLDNGDFMYLGRNDDQVKIRGLRVELGEIEQKIKAFPDIERVLVRALSHETLGKVLAAYYIQDTFKKCIEENAIRDYLHSCLPEHMVPTYLIKVPHFPIMRNGKIDYHALPNPFTASEHFDHEQCSKIEQILIQIFSELFKIDEKSVSLDHDFFALGGHSLLATQMVARLQQHLKLQLPVAKIFELRTIKKFAEYLSTLKDDNASLLSLTSLPENTPIPLSYSQRLLWFFFQLDKNSSLYNIPFLIRFKKANKDYLIRAFNHIIEQNAVLRTIFEETNEDEPIQKILPSIDFKIPVYESSELFYREISAWNKASFDLIQGPLFRAAITNEGKDILLYLNIHHIIFDGWSFKVFMEQLAKTYEAIQKKLALPILISNFSYADFIYSQHQWVKEGKLSKELSYWQHLLQGATTTLDLPTDFPYPKQRDYTGNTISVALSSPLTTSLKELALENKTTLFSVLLTAYFILLYRYTKQPDMLIGTPIANRFQAELEPIMGYLVNISIYRQQLSNKKTFHELLQSVHQNACDAADNQALPFDVLLNSLEILFDPKQNPLFQVMFSLQTGHKLSGPLGKTGISFTVDEKHANGAKADILMALNEMEDGSLQGYVEYRTDLFTEASILHLKAHYNNLLQAIVDNPTASIAELTILSYEEYEYLVKTWPYGKKAPLPTQTVLEKVEEATSHYYDFPALKFHDQTFTYAEFWEKVEMLATHISRRNMASSHPSMTEPIIGILMPRGPEMIIAMCAIWRAGAAFLPLDADYPDDRLRYMVQDSDTHIIVSVAELSAKQSIFENMDVLFVEVEGPTENVIARSVLNASEAPLCKTRRGNPEKHLISMPGLPRRVITSLTLHNTAPCNDVLRGHSLNKLAYIIYTSGSTGHPKGVALEHFGLSNVINYVVDLYQLRANMRVLQFTSINFDAAIKEIFSALTSGACLYIVDSEMRRSPEKLQAFIAEQKIQLASLQPVVLESFEKTPIPGLEIIDIGGDACDTNTINFWQNHCRLLNTYGPTETTIICSTKHYDSPVVTQNIGRPLYNTEMFILDEDLNPVPTGVIGELFVGGMGLARGYWKREKLTFEKFILHPFSDDPNARLYRTGDYARWLPNGELDFIGRIDNQVKIRGYRIETGEIEALLNTYPKIKQAVVIAKKEQQILVAYFTSREEINTDQLRTHLAETLPEYMIPAAFISMDVLPLNLSGKVDRKALQAEDFQAFNLGHSFVEPSNEIEKILWGIWKEVLKIENLGVENSFFELGGHSLTVTQMISRVKKQLKLNLPITQVFELRTIRRIANYLFTLKKESTENLTLWHSPKKNRGPLSYAQKQMWFLYELDPTSVVYNIPMLMRFENTNSELLIKSLYYVLEKNPIFRTVIDNTEDEPVQVIRKKTVLNIPFYDSIEMFKAEVNHWDNTPFDLVNGPVFRAAFAQDNNTTLVYFNIHHIAFDGWSTNVLMQQWLSIYTALANNINIPFFKTEYQYIDYAYSQNRWLTENRLADQFDFWKKFLHGAQTTLDLPTDFPYPDKQSFEGNLVTFALSASLTKSLKNLANTYNTTVSAVLLAGFFALLYRYTKQSDIIIGVPIAGRYHAALEPIIGFFINESIYRQQLSPHQSFSDLLKSVHQNACDAADNQALPFNEILDKLNTPVDPTRNPLFQVLFDYQAVLPSISDTQHIHYSFEERNHTTAKLDLSLSLMEMPDTSIKGGVEYRTDLFTEISIQHLCGHYQNLLQEIIKSPESPCVSFNILTPTEYHQLAHILPNGKSLPLPEKTVLEIIEAAVNKYPSIPALIFNHTSLSYKALWEKIEILATHLSHQPILGILMPRGIEMIIAMCAIWKVGAAFLPLDADYPNDRLRYMLDDAGVKVILSVSHLTEKQAGLGNDLDFVEVDKVWEDFSLSRSVNQGASYSSLKDVTTLEGRSKEKRAHQEDLAYVIYTSGSTGNPKGVLLNHIGLSNIIQCIRDMYNLQPTTHVLQFSSINFDASMGEIFSALISGASLYIVDSETRSSTEKLQHFIAKNKIQVASLQPAILESFEKKPIKNLEIIDIGGDACDTNTINFWRHHCRLLNTYGPTEATIICAAKHYNTHAIAQNIGQPLYNTQIFIVDEYFNPVPTGVMGEIFIGGAGLARGYLNREDLTTERFVPHFLSNDPNARLYRTGDYGRWLTNGEIEFIGRIDNQVKIRGYRIEMGEIEALLNNHTSIKQAVVIAQKELQILVAYFTFREEIESDQLRQYLAETLPEYMIPSAFIPLDALPLNLSGKIDRKALQAQDFRLFSPVQSFVQPTNSIEIPLWKIWKDILKTDQFGIENSFFELGGHSLLITQMISRVKKNLKLTLSIAKVFELRTIHRLSDYLLTLQQEAKENLTLWHAPESHNAPLSYAQKQMWFFYQLNPLSCVYNIPMLMRFKKANQANLIQTFYHVIEQNPIFRTLIDNTGEETVQVLLTKPNIDFPIYESFELFQKDIQQWDITPFDLVNGPVFRLALVKEIDDILVYFNVHHIAFDGWSTGILMQQIKAIYAALEKNKPLPKITTRYSYLDYAYSQHRWLIENRLAEQATFWQHFLQDAQTTLDLPTDFPYPSKPTFSGNTLTFTLPAALANALKTIAINNHTTLFSVTLAAFFSLLYRYTKQDDIIIGVPIAGRYHAALEPIIGFFVNESIYRQRLSKTQTFQELLTSVHQNSCDAAENQALPFNEILDKLNLPVDPSKNPLFQVLFNYVALDPIIHKNEAHLDYQFEERSHKSAKLDITLSIAEMPDGSLQGGVEYRTDLFTELSIQHLCAHYKNLLQEIVINPNAALSSYRILSEPEYELLVNTWPYGEKKSLPEKNALDIIKEAVNKYPDLPALIFENNVITYASFWEKVTTLADIIIESYLALVGANSISPLIIGLLMPRGIEMIIAMCAIWKAGAAFLPLDADYPEERLQYMVKDSDTHLIVSVTELREKQAVFEKMDVRFVEVDAPAENVIARSVLYAGEAPQYKTRPDGPSLNELAYIIYTSGSTGNPKGVAVPHRGITNLVGYLHDLYKLSPEKRVLQFSSINFDAAIGEIFSGLTAGASLYIVDNDTRRSIEHLQNFIKYNKIHVVSMPPAALEHFEKSFLPDLETIIIGGDTCEPQVINFWKNQCRLINGYGPTEATVYTLTKQFEAHTLPNNIGRPLYNAETFILDEDLHPVPTGVMGELFIGGAGLAQGYLNRNDLTQEKFIPNPFSKNSEAKLYRSGDYARWLPNGEIEFIGRIDNQVKIRGYRIEIGEIETLLNVHADIKQAVVIAQKEQQILVVYFTSEIKIESEVLWQYLTDKLPEYMIPAAFVQLDALPLNLSGKIDRKGLQAKNFRLLNNLREFQKPSNEMESTLVKIWKEILKTDQFGIDNSFFELGGHSLLVTQMISRVKKNLKLTLLITKVFELRTIRKLSEYLLTLQQEAKEKLSLIPAPQSNKAPLSYAQKQMWFFYQLNPHSSAYNIPMLMRFEKANQAFIVQAFSHTIEQNPIFRTVIDNTHEEPVQIVLKNFSITFPIYDSLERFYDDITQWDTTPFDLVNGPVFRLALVKKNEDILVYFNVHHIAFDGWSTNIFMRQIIETYAALEKDQPLPDFSTEYHYIDYAYSQNHWLEKNYLADQTDFWHHFLQDAQTTLDLPTDFPYPQEQIFLGNTLPFDLSKELSRSLKNLANHNNTTLFAVTLAAFFVLLYRYTKQQDILIGVPISGRYQEALEPIIGFFVNESLYRQKLSNTKTFHEILHAIHQNACDAAENQALPFNKILDNLNVPLDPKKNPLFQVLFSYQAADPFTDDNNTLTSMRYHLEERQQGSSKLDLSLFISETTEGTLQGRIEYRTDLFTELSMQHLCGHYQRLLQEIVDNPSASLVSYRILSEPEYELLVNRWPHGEKKPLPQKTAIEMIEFSVQQYSDVPALVFENNVLTYTSFWEKVTKLAHLIESYLILAGENNIRPLIIGLLMPRGIDMIIAMCAIWKAGAAFLPLDSEYPDDRLQYMVKDSDTHIIVSVSTLKEKQRVFEGMDVGFVEVDAPAESVIAKSVLNASEAPQCKTRRGNDVLRGSIFPEISMQQHLAYIIYTSGSTGNPKGVMVKHQGLSNLIPYLQDIYQLQPHMKVLQFTSINFDVSMAEIFPALVSGATLHIVNQNTRLSVADLQHYIHQHHIQLLSIPPTVLEHFEQTALPRVETIIIGGDRCDSRVINYWKKQCRLINGYGPTEATVYALTKQFETRTLPNNIGRPLYNVEAFILDEDLHPTPTGVMGELFIGGLGLAEGYLNRPELTQEKFIEHPFSVNSEAKLYRSGDYARWLPNGEIEFIGRIDNQVKIRGYRIEIGEIETLLNAYSNIEQSIVIAKKEQQILIAYLTSTKKINAKLIRAYLADKLPEYMIPSAFIQLETFPINLSGKIDRKVLQAKDFRLLNHVLAFVEPSNDIEKTLWMIWKEILNTEQFGIDNSFFELGGHSLLVTQMLSRVKRYLKLNLSIAKIFEHRTIRNIANYLSTLQQEIQDNLRLLHAPENNKAPLSYAQKQMWFFYQLNPHSSAYNMPMLMRFKNADADLFVQALHYIINQNPIFRTVIDASEIEPQQIILKNLNVSVPFHHAHDFYQLIDQWDILPFDLESGPVFRTAFTKDNKDILFYFNIHHIAFDGWSVDIFMQQLFSTYAALEKNAPLPLFTTEYQYIDYAYSQNYWLENNFLQDQLAFWKHFLQDAQTTLDLPTDYPYPQEQSFKGETLDFNLESTVFEELKLLATENNTTLFAVTLAAFFALLYRYTKQDDIIIGVPIAGRYQSSLEHIIGFFVNESVYRQGLSNTQTFRELLNAVHQNACDAAENQVLPFNKIIDNLNIPVDPKKNPLFQVLFNYQTVSPIENSANTKLSVKFEDRPQTIAKLDITLSVAETLKDGLNISIEYRTDLFTELSMQHLGAHYQNLLNEIINNPDASLGSYSILSKPEYELLVNTWPYGKKKPLPEKTVLEMVEDIVKKHENSLALVFEEQCLTFGEFWNRVECLSNYLFSIARDVGRNPIIGMLMPRGPEMIIAMCAIWKVGGAFLPLDANYPDDRLIYMAQDSDVRIIVSVSELKDRWNIFDGMDVMFVEGDSPTENVFKEESYSDSFLKNGNNSHSILTANDFSVRRERSRRGSVRVVHDRSRCSSQQNRKLISEEYNSSLDALAYIIYTSGSTGDPKGVMIEHLGLSNVIMHMQRAYQLPVQTKKLQFASINFDNAMVEIFFALCSEHTLFIANNKIRHSMPLLQNYLLDKNIEFISIPPAVLESFEKKNMPHLKIIDCGGDTCDPDVIDYWKKQCSVVNGYGPTEATIITSSKIYTTDSSSRNIGRPLDNTEIFILDEDFHAVPTGIIGEILIGGVGLARGYLKRETLTKEKFISHPFSQDPTARLYRTGDYGRWLPNGDIEFIGRIDNQVKLRGYRIEMGEIEALLNTYPGIKQCAVIAKREQQVLIAYFTGKKGIKPKHLQQYLTEKLPEYMVPAAFIHLDALPLSLSGKIDRKSLQAKDFRLIKKVKNMIQPRNEQEQQLWNIWTQLFKFDQISIKDSFFDLGGHSLLASKASSQFKATYHRDCPVSVIFQYKTIEAIVRNLNDTVDQKSLMFHDIKNAKNKLEQFVPKANVHKNVSYSVLKDVTTQDKKSVEGRTPDPERQNRTSFYSHPPKVVLMTGAHGFLGAHILERLLQDTHLSIICIVRARTQKELKQKVKKDLARFNLDALGEHPQVQWLKGDLSKTLLGLNAKTYHKLCETVDSIYHCGAWVNHILDYQNLRATNVDSTLTLLEMCATHHRKILNYISTANVGEVFQHPEAIENFGGYIQSKWVSESILQEAQKLGISINIFRPGNITGHSKTGICVPENNHALSLIKSCIQLGIAPIWEYNVEMMPVDLISEAIVKYSQNSLTHRNIPLDLSNIHSLSWKTYMQYLNKLGLKVQMVSFVEWQMQLNTLSEDNALFPFKTLYADMSPEAALTTGEGSQHHDLLKEIDLHYPEDYQALVSLYWTYLTKIGFLNN
jgi:amino acid adenylation domain-containing protein/thioester reductase-like protein